MPNSIVLLLTSVANEADAHILAEGLVRERLVACVQISARGVSVYHWQGQIEMEPEYYLSIKTSAAKSDVAEAWLLEHHPYDVPEIVRLDASASSAYASWVEEEVG